MIDYQPYLNDVIWPSESGSQQGMSTMVSRVSVMDMAPQHAVSALHKLLRWSTQYVRSEAEEEEARASVRSSVLGKALSCQALGMRDLSLDDSTQFTSWLDQRTVAKLMAHGLLDSVELDPMDAGRLAIQLSAYLTDHNYKITKEA